MAVPPEREAYEGLANLANAIRRSTALYVAAAYVCTPEDSIDTLEDTTNRLARLLGGRAEQADQQPPEPGGKPLGEPWPLKD